MKSLETRERGSMYIVQYSFLLYVLGKPPPHTKKGSCTSGPTNKRGGGKGWITKEKEFFCGSPYPIRFARIGSTTNSLYVSIDLNVHFEDGWEFLCLF